MGNKIAIVYKSRTGFTKRYAEMIAEEVECTLLDFSDVNSKIMSEFDTVVYGSRLHAGNIDGYKKAKVMFDKSTAKQFVSFVTGATPAKAEDIINDLWKNNLSNDEMESIPHFYMQSGLCYEKMCFADKTMMKMAAVMMKNKKDKTDHEKGFEEAISKSYDISSKEYIKDIVALLKNKLNFN